MIVANMSSYPPRKKELVHSIQSLHAQVDKINLCLNEFEEIPEELDGFSKLNPVIPDKDYKDVGKFIFPCAKNDMIVLTDDDIIYPPDYVEKMLNFYNSFAIFNCIVGIHGCIYIDAFDGDQSKEKVFSFTQGLLRPRVVNQLGTGTVFLKADQLPSLKYMDGSQRFVDVRFSRYMLENEIGMICVPREKNWLREVSSGSMEGLWNTFTKKWPLDIIKETQAIAGYSKLNLELVYNVEG